jgi:uncharacterized membrane protein YagU involved in acid resistance
MKEEITKLLKLTFLIHFFVSIIFGLIFLLLSDYYLNITGWPSIDPIVGQPLSGTLGAAFIGFALSSLLAWRETEWIKVKLIVQMEIGWLAIGLNLNLWIAFTYFPPIIIWLHIIIFVVFLIAFSWFYYIHEMKKT